MTDEQLLELFANLGSLSVEVMRCGADLWRELKSRKTIDLSSLDHSVIIGQIRSIAMGRTTAEVAYRFGDSPDALKKIVRLPIEEQTNLVKDSRVSVIERDPETRELTERKLPIESLRNSQLRQLFSEKGELRTPDQQRAFIVATTVAVPEVPRPAGRITISRGKIRTDGDVPIEEVIAALRAAGHLPKS